MSDNVLPSLYPTLSPDSELPEFVTRVDEKYLCISCKQVLREAVQTPCGHRLCRTCWSEVIQGQTSAPCPAGEDECTPVTQEQVYPDFSARKEISRLEIYCKHRADGCHEIIKWAKLKNHLDLQCQFSNYPCPFNCGKTVHGPTDLEKHKDECPNRPTAALEVKEKVESFIRDVKALQNDRKELDRRTQTLEKRQRDIITSVAGFGVKVNNMEAAFGTLLQKPDFDQLVSEFKKLAETVQIQAGKIRRLEENQGKGGASASNVSGDAMDALRHHERQLSIVDVRLAEVDLRMLSMESTNYSGVLIWKITEYKRRKQEAVAGKTISLYSQPFFTTRYGYRMCARAYLNGDGQGRGTHFSLFFVLMKGEYDNLLPFPFSQRVTMTLMDQETKKKNLSDTFRPDPSSSSFRKPVSEMNVASGCPLFVRQTQLEQPPYLIDDAIFLKISVDTSDLQLH